jgi:tetratricopeptide (TPR) repeat protein
MNRARTGLILLLLAGTLSGAAAWADGPRPSRPTTGSPVSDEAAWLVEIDGWLAGLVGRDPDGRERALALFEQATPAMVPPLAKRLADIEKSADRVQLAAALDRLRRPSERLASFDWLERAMALPRPEDAVWRELVSILTMARTLARIGTTSSIRELIGIYAALGEPFRIDVERKLAKLEDRPVPALIEARHAESKPIRFWAGRLLESMGKIIPGSAVQTSDNQVLADVLLAYGRARDADAARVIVAFANSDRNQLREAARQAVAFMGEAGMWQLKEAYENLVGKKPPEDWAWDRVASELFAAFDRVRLSEVYQLMDDGVAAEKAGKLDEMAHAFDQVLARAPLFERRAEMVPGYLALARSVADSDRTRALSLLRKAMRIDPSAPLAKAVEAELTYLEAVDLASRGIVDRSAYQRAVALDPNNERARAAWKRIEEESGTRMAAWRRYAGAGFAALGVAFAALGLWRWRRPRAKVAP